MVIGNGLIARRFASYDSNDRFLVFASGISNSKTTNPAAYERELQLLGDCINRYSDKCFIYFSTCSVYDPEEKNSLYVQHKLQIEKFIQDHVKQHRIFRVSNLAGHSGNLNTVLNFFYYHVKNGINFDLWVNACRNIIDVDDAYMLIDYILQNDLFPNERVNIANPASYPVKEIVTTIETFLKTGSNYIEINKGSCFDIDTSVIKPMLKKTGLSPGNEYLYNLLTKYFQ
jgi:nucleoside-diphosphate-sugar epimerase